MNASGIRKLLLKKGYKWLPRSQKRMYSLEERRTRKAFARKVLRLTVAELRRQLAMSLDGVILTMPPKDATDRYNYCRFGEGHMWRKPCESNNPELAGDDPYGKQAPLARCIPMWGGIGAGGTGIVSFHENKKLTVEEWLKALRAGSFKKAILSTSPVSKRGPWTVLCDNEGFLHNKDAKALYRKGRIIMWHVPPKSPDLNPVEKFWAFLRKHLRAMDLKDAMADRPVLGKTAYRERVRRVMKSTKASRIAGRTLLSLRKSCLELIKKKGSATKG